jgi:hypothetical protein
VGGEELFRESAATHLVGLINSSSWQRVGCLVALLSQRWRWMVSASAYEIVEGMFYCPKNEVLFGLCGYCPKYEVYFGQ